MGVCRVPALAAFASAILASSVGLRAIASSPPADAWAPFVAQFRATRVPVLLPNVAAGFPAFTPPFRRSGSTPSQVYPTVHAERDRYSVTLEQAADRCDGAIACTQMTIAGEREPARGLPALAGRRVALAGGVVGFLESRDAYGHAGIVWERGSARYEIVDHGFGASAVVAAANSALVHGPYRFK